VQIAGGVVRVTFNDVLALAERQQAVETHYRCHANDRDAPRRGT